MLNTHEKQKAIKAVPLIDIVETAVDVIPGYPVRLTGYGNRLSESEGVATRTHARALVIRGKLKNHGAHCNEATPPTVPITVDNWGVPANVIEAVYDRVSAEHSIDRKRFIMSSNRLFALSIKSS